MNCDHCNKNLTPADIPYYQDLKRMEKLKPKLYFRCKLCREGIYQHKDLPVKKAMKIIDGLAGDGGLCFVKFTCHHCLARQGLGEPNTFFTEGISCEECGRLTIPDKIGWMFTKRLN